MGAGSSHEVGRRERRRIEVQERILDAAASLFEEQGYDETTVEEIAERADVAKGTLFNHFPRKDALLLAVGDAWCEALLESLRAPDTWGGSWAAWLRRLFGAFAEKAERHPSLAKVMVIEGMRTIWLRAEVPPGQAKVRLLVRSLIERGQASGEFGSSVDAAVAAALLEGAYGTTLVEWLVSGAGDRTLIEELNAKFDIVFRGLAAGGSEEGGRA